jgi:hypothetical protein
MEACVLDPSTCSFDPIQKSALQMECRACVQTSERLTVAWALTKIEDRNGNEITIEYDTIESEQNQWSVDRVPSRITYGPDRIVDFAYEDRSDPVNSFRGAAERIDPLLTGGHRAVRGVYCAPEDVTRSDELIHPR